MVSEISFVSFAIAMASLQCGLGCLLPLPPATGKGGTGTTTSPKPSTTSPPPIPRPEAAPFVHVGGPVMAVAPIPNVSDYDDLDFLETPRRSLENNIGR